MCERFFITRGIYHRTAMVEAILTFPRYPDRMAFDSGNFDLTLAAAAGDDPSLRRELRRGYIESLELQLDLLARSRCDGNWMQAASRVRSLAASFHDAGLLDLAHAALSAAPGEPTVLRAIENHLAEIGGH